MVIERKSQWFKILSRHTDRADQVKGVTFEVSEKANSGENNQVGGENQ